MCFSITDKKKKCIYKYSWKKGIRIMNTVHAAWHIHLGACEVRHVPRAGCCRWHVATFSGCEVRRKGSGGSSWRHADNYSELFQDVWTVSNIAEDGPCWEVNSHSVVKQKGPASHGTTARRWTLSYGCSNRFMTPHRFYHMQLIALPHLLLDFKNSLFLSSF
jgi:hypothetical protein